MAPIEAYYKNLQKTLFLSLKPLYYSAYIFEEKINGVNLGVLVLIFGYYNP